MYRSFFFSDRCVKHIDSMLPWVCLVTDHRGRQNVVKTSVTNSPAACVALHCFYHIFTSSVICYEQTHGNMESIQQLVHASACVCRDIARGKFGEYERGVRTLAS